MKYMSLSAATDNLKSFFADKPNSDYVSLEDIYMATNRESKSEKINKSWVTNKMTHLRHYGLVNSEYSNDRPARFIGVRLTSEGKKALTRDNANNQSKEVTLETLARDIREYERENPSIELDLSVKIKKEVEATV